MEKMLDPFEEAELREKSEEARAQFEKELELATRKVLESKEGRMVLGWILDVTGFDSSISCNEAMTLSNLSGRRDVGLLLKGRLEHVDYEKFVLLEKERRKWLMNN